MFLSLFFPFFQATRPEIPRRTWFPRPSSPSKAIRQGQATNLPPKGPQCSTAAGHALGVLVEDAASALRLLLPALRTGDQPAD